MDNKYCVYIHTTPSGKRYVGITKNVRDRWRNGKGYKIGAFKLAIDKYGWENINHEIVISGISEDYAKQYERVLIKIYRTNEKKHGYNLTEGGDGTTGYKLSEETKAKIQNSRKNYVVSEETKEKMRNSQRNRKHSQESKDKIGAAHKGMKHTEESIIKMSNSSSFKIKMFTKDGEYIKTFLSALQAQKETGVERTGIRKCCSGRYKQAGGFKWEYCHDN